MRWVMAGDATRNGHRGQRSVDAGARSHDGRHAVSTTSRDQTPLDQVRVGDLANFQDGPPLELFRRLRSECPVHWTERIAEYPDEDGFWSVTTADDVYEVSRDWETFSSEIGGFTAMKNAGLSLELQQAMFIGMDPPKHDRLKALFQRGFTPKRIAEHEDAIRAITIDVLDRLEGRESCDLVDRRRTAGRRRA